MEGNTPTRALSEIIGQPEMVKRLETLVALARRKGEVFGHTLFIGPDGSGKRSFAYCVARELGVKLWAVDTSRVERVADFATIIKALDKGDVLLLTDINRLSRNIAILLPSAMKKFEIDVPVGEGLGTHIMKLEIQPFTLIGTVQKRTDCAPGLLRLFNATFELQKYTTESMSQLALRLAEQAKMMLDAEATALVAYLADGNPGQIEPTLRNLRFVEKSIRRWRH